MLDKKKVTEMIFLQINFLACMNAKLGLIFQYVLLILLLRKRDVFLNQDRVSLMTLLLQNLITAKLNYYVQQPSYPLVQSFSRGKPTRR